MAKHSSVKSEQLEQMAALVAPKTEVVAPANPADMFSPVELEFIQGLSVASDGFAGFWTAERGDKIFGWLEGRTEIGNVELEAAGNGMVYKIRLAFPAYIYQKESRDEADLAPAGAIVAVWKQYQLALLDDVAPGTKLAICKGEKVKTKTGKFVNQYQLMVDPAGLPAKREPLPAALAAAAAPKELTSGGPSKSADPF